MRRYRSSLRTKYKIEIEMIIANKEKINWDKQLHDKLFGLLD